MLSCVASGTCRSQPLRTSTASAPQGCGDEDEDAAEGRLSQELVGPDANHIDGTDGDPEAFRARRRPEGHVVQVRRELNVKQQ